MLNIKHFSSISYTSHNFLKTWNWVFTRLSIQKWSVTNFDTSCQSNLNQINLLHNFVSEFLMCWILSILYISINCHLFLHHSPLWWDTMLNVVVPTWKKICGLVEGYWLVLINCTACLTCKCCCFSTWLCIPMLAIPARNRYI